MVELCLSKKGEIMSIIIMILLLSILILVHELGHFLAALFFKIKVDKFGFGLPIGPVLYKTKWGNVEILIHAFLLGGYVSFPEDEKDCALEENSPERFSNKPIYQRAIVLSAGVISNVLCAFVFVFLTAALWGHLPSGKYDIYVNDIIAAKTENIWQSGLQKKDRIAEINGSKINTMYSLLSFVKLSKSYDGKVNSTLITNKYYELNDLNPIFSQNEIIPTDVAIRLPVQSYEEPVKLNEKVLKGMKKQQNDEKILSKPQLKLRDQLKNNKTHVYISNGEYSLDDLAYALSDNQHPVNIMVERNNKLINLNTTFVNKNGQLGIKLEAKELFVKTNSIKSVFSGGTKYLYDNTYMLLYGLYQIFTGQIPLKDLHGIVAITKVGGDIITNNGIFSGFLLTAIISMDLAIINFLPIPALDGGHLLFLLIEKFKGRPVNEELLEKISNIGFYFLLALMFVVIFNDIFGLITKKY